MSKGFICNLALLRRTYTTSAPPSRVSLVAPTEPTFYTGRPRFYDHLRLLEDAASHGERALRSLQLLPLPAFAREALPPYHPVWKGKQVLVEEMGCNINHSRYRRLTSVLNQLHNTRRIAMTAGVTDLAERVDDVLSLYEYTHKRNFRDRDRTGNSKFDQYGRSYTVGRRKESSARVWMIPIRKVGHTDTKHDDDSAADQLGINILPQRQRERHQVVPTTVLVNNIPLAQYFRKQHDREHVIRPLKLGGALTSFNVFTIVRGGGTTGQAGAIMHGIARGLAIHEPELLPMLKKTRLVRRDPRMVERKKPGLAKARKRYAWVKR